MKENFANIRAETKSDGEGPYAPVFIGLSKEIAERWNNMSAEEKKVSISHVYVTSSVARWFTTQEINCNMPAIVLDFV